MFLVVDNLKCQNINEQVENSLIVSFVPKFLFYILFFFKHIKRYLIASSFYTSKEDLCNTDTNIDISIYIEHIRTHIFLDIVAYMGHITIFK